MRRSGPLEWLVACLLLVGASASAVRAQDAEEPTRPTIYKWVDTNGIAHYTTDPKRIPDTLRGDLRRLGHPRDESARSGGLEAAVPSVHGADAWAVRDAPPAGSDYVGIGDAYEPYRAETEPAALGQQRRNELEDQIGTLEGEIARSEEFMKSMIASPSGPLELADDAEFRDVARRLPKLHTELRTLREEHEQLQEP